MGEKQQYGLLAGLFIIAVVMAAGCSGSSSQSSTPVPTTAPQDKYSAGDIAAKTASATDEFYIILSYDMSKDMYTRALVYRNSDGSWQRNGIANSTLSRAIFEKLYPARITHMDLSAVPVVTPTVPPVVQTTFAGAGPGATNVTPSTGGQGTTVTLTISGSNFQTGATAKLVRGGSPTVSASAVSVTSTSVTGTFNLNKADQGYYNVIVVNPDGRSAMLAGAFQVGEPAPIITAVYPNTGAIGDTLGLTISGQNFGDVDKVSFTMGSSVIDPIYITNVVTTPGPKISCSLKIPSGTPLGDWTVTVLDVDSQQSGSWDQKFHITNATA